MKFFSKNFLFVFFLFSFHVANAKSYWGAIYVNEATGIAGGGINYDTEKDAEKIAIAQCKKKHNGAKAHCVPALTFHDSCGAVAWSKSKKMAGGGWAESSEPEAKSQALKRCKSKGGGDCKIILSACTAWEVWEEWVEW